MQSTSPLFSIKNGYPFLKYYLKGLSQIMLQENIFTGILLIAGVFLGSLNMGLAVSLATLVGSYTAYFLNFNKKQLEKGAYGFNAALVGAAMLLFLKPLWITWIIVVLASVIATLLQHCFIKWKLSVFTLPFVLVTWVFLLGVQYFDTSLLVVLPPDIISDSDKFFFPIKGFGQVIFQSSILSGLLFFIGVFINKRIATLYGLVGAFVCGMIALCFTTHLDEVWSGLYSYNAVLCAIVLAGKKIVDAFWILISILLSFCFYLILKNMGIPILTFPFVAAVIITIKIKSIVMDLHNRG